MKDTCESCPHERVHTIEYRALNEGLRDVRERVTRVETTLGRGMALLLANLAAIIVALTKGFLSA